MEHLSVVVFHPTGESAFANVHTLGNAHAEMSMNEHGFFPELNNGRYSDGETYDRSESRASVLVTALVQCKTIHQAVAFLAGVPAESSYVIQHSAGRRPTCGFCGFCGRTHIPLPCT